MRKILLIVVALVGIAIAIAVAIGIAIITVMPLVLQMINSMRSSIDYEEVNIEDVYAYPTDDGWNIYITYINRGSKPSKIDNIFINHVPYDSWGAALNVTLPAPADVGQAVSLTITIPNGATYGNQTLVSPSIVAITLHSTGNKEYFSSVILP